MKPRRGARCFATAALVALLAILTPGVGLASECGPRSFGGMGAQTCDHQVAVMSAAQASGQGAPVSASGGDLWLRHDVCVEWFSEEVGGVRYPGSWDGVVPECAEGTTEPVGLCVAGEEPLAPWWVSRDQGGGVYGPWVQVSSYQCGTDVLLAAVEREWRSMVIAPNVVTTAPGEGWVVGELGFIGMVDTAPRTKNVTVLGTPVTIRAVPTQYVWVASDGNTWTATDAGKPFDQGGEPFTFAPASEHRAQVTVTTTWRGEYTTTNGSTWRDAPGTATTTSAPFSLHVYSPTVHRVDCDLNGNCLSGHQAPEHPATLLDPDADGIDNYTIPDNDIDQYLKERASD